MTSLRLKPRRNSANDTWPVQDAKARFSEFLDACVAGAPQIVTRRGVEAAVLVPVDLWRRMEGAARPGLKALLSTDEARVDQLVPATARGKAHRRVVKALR